MSGTQGQLPEGWESVRIAHLCELINGRAFKPTEWTDKGLPIIRIQNLNNLDAKFNHFNGYYDEKHLVRPGDLLFAWSGTPGTSFGAHVWRGGIALLNQHIFRVVPPDGLLDKTYLRFAINYNLDELIHKAQGGVGLRHVTKGTFENTEIPLPPLAEQRRIVAKIEALQERSRRAREALMKVEPLLEQFRQSVLVAAFRGDLTADWRSAHPNVEPASDLLHRICTERRHRWEQSELAKYEVKGQKPPKNWQDKYEELELVDASELPELPKGWVWTTWESILSLDDGSFKRGPFGSALKKSIFVSSGYKVYEEYCPINDDCSYVRYYITPEKYEELKAFAVKARDFLISCSGVTLGRITQVPDDFEEGIINQALLRVRINNEIVNDQFFLKLFRSPYFQKQIFDNATGSAIPNVKGVKDLKSILVPFPPVAEQLEVLERLKERLDYTRGIEDGVKESNAAFDHLDQAIFAKAFRGEFVPQDPKDEPASVLLERIRAQRAKQIEAAKLDKETSKTLRRNTMRKKSSELSSQHQPLAEVLTTKGKPMSPEQLLTESGYDDDSIEDFYFALREEIAQGRIRENRSPESDIMLEAVNQ